MRGTLAERLYARLELDEATGCLLWTGCLNSKGYGCIGVGAGKSQLVHRVAWTLERGPIPDGLTIDHVYDRGCRHKHCVNVAHLEPVTTKVNTRRSLAQRGFVKYDPAYQERVRQLRAAAPVDYSDWLGGIVQAANRRAVQLGLPAVPVPAPIP